MLRISPGFLGFICAAALNAAPVSDLDREIVLAPQSGVAREDVEITRWQEQARGANATREMFERLAWAFVAKARRTLDAGFYKLAEKTADVIDAQFGVGADSLLLRGHVLHNLHRFHDAETIARRLVEKRGLPVDWALLSDVLVEQGKVDEGVEALQRMVDVKPGVEADSRIAHVRWLKGNLPGAIAATESALGACDVRDTETQGWLTVRLSGFHLQRGDAAAALALAEKASARLADYPPALLARGRALLALDRVEDAILSLRQAEQLQPLPEYQWWLADALAVAGRREEAAVVEQRLRARGAENDPRTLALFLATRGEDATTALRLARVELKDRADVLTHDALGWSLAAMGDFEAAQAQMRLALAEGTQDARLFLHAGEIARARGDGAAAAAYFARAHAVASTLTPSERARLTRRVSKQDEIASR